MAVDVADQSPPTCGSASPSSLVLALAIGSHQRLPGGADRHPQLPGHARHVLHAPGLNLAVTKVITATSAPTTSPTWTASRGEEGLRLVPVHDRLGRDASRVTLFWWIAVPSIATWVLLRTQSGNWIFAAGGAQQSARAVGVPVNRSRSGCSCRPAARLVDRHAHPVRVQHRAVRHRPRQRVHLHHRRRRRRVPAHRRVRLGDRRRHRRLHLRHDEQGIVYAGWDPDWFYFFLGAMLLGAILLNNWVQQSGAEMTT